MNNYTYGLELELLDFDRRYRALPYKCTYSKTEIDLVNNNGIAVNPHKNSTYFIGGEVNTPPTKTIDEQIDYAHTIIADLQPGINYRCQLHTHVAPVEKYDLQTLKNILTYIQNKDNYATVLAKVWQMHEKTPDMPNSYFSAAVSKVFYMPEYMYTFCMAATTIQEFRDAWFYSKAGKKASLIFKRFYVNVYSFFKHGTIEFRVFRPTLDCWLIEQCLLFSQAFLEQAVLGAAGKPVAEYVDEYTFPKPLPFDAALEAGYAATRAYKK